MSDITVASAGPIGMITVRGELTALAGGLETVTGCTLPEQRMSTSSGACEALWMSPDELLIVCDHAEAPDLARRLAEALADTFATVAVVSDARVVFDVTGPDAQRALAKLCPVDFARLAATEVRRTRLAQVPAALWRRAGGWRVVCFRSVSDYAEALLRNAAA